MDGNALARAIGAQGVQNGGIDSASVAGAVPGGVRSLMAENLMVMMRNLEACLDNPLGVCGYLSPRTRRSNTRSLLAGRSWCTSTATTLAAAPATRSAP